MGTGKGLQLGLSEFQTITTPFLGVHYTSHSVVPSVAIIIATSVPIVWLPWPEKEKVRESIQQAFM